MKKKKVGIYFEVEVDGEIHKLIVSEEELRNVIKNSKIRRDKEEEIILQFETNGKKTNVAYKMSLINSVLKKATLTKNIIPTSLDEYLEDLTQKLVQKPIMPIAKREHELEKVWFYISQKVRNNVFLTGEIDVGKTAIAHEIARQISTNECPKEFYEKRVLLLRPDKLLNIKSDRIYENTVRKVMNFLVENRKSIVLYIDNAFFMITDELLIMMLYACIKKYNIPMIATINSEYFDRYFLENKNISKYLNEVYVKEPEMEDIKPMIENHLKLFENRYKVKCTEEAIKFGIYTACLSESTSYEPGNVISIFEKAFREARRKGKKEVDKKCILSCYNTYYKIYEKLTKKSLEAISYHETGHYIVQIKCKNQKDMKISCVSILPMMDWMGVNIPYRDGQEFGLYSKEYFIDDIAIYLAGRVAEKKITNTESSSASSDLEYASMYAKAIVMQWGFSDKDGNRNRSYDYEDLYLMPESKKELIDKEIQELIDAGMKRAEEIINENEGLLKVIAERLMVDEILTGEELEQICKEYEKGNTTEEVEETVEKDNKGEEVKGIEEIAETPKETE